MFIKFFILICKFKKTICYEKKAGGRGGVTRPLLHPPPQIFPLDAKCLLEIQNLEKIFQIRNFFTDV